MIRFFLPVIFGLLLFSCKKNFTEIKQPVNVSNDTLTGFKIKGILKKVAAKTVYLNKIIESSIYPIDSSEVLNDKFIFKGIVTFPERFALTFEDYATPTIFIIENTQFELFLSSSTLNSPVITGSALNKKLSQYKVKSKNIFKKIEYLFSQFQKARLENDAKKLEEIGIKLKNIETKFVEFSYHFILENRKSFIAPMILRDLLNSETLDTLRIKKTYQQLSPEVKKSPDALIIASFLNLN